MSLASVDRERLVSFPLLRRFAEADRAAVAEHLQCIEVETDQVVFESGDESHGLVFVAEGVLRVERGANDVLGRAGRGECFGGFALASIGAREVRAVAERVSTLLVLSRGAYLRLADESPRTACRLLEAVLEEVASATREALPRLGGCG